MALDRDRLDAALSILVRRLLDRRAAPDHWEGHLASSALSTATAVLALDTAARNGFPAADRSDPVREGRSRLAGSASEP